MAKGKKKQDQSKASEVKFKSEKVELPKPSENEVKFHVWFSAALKRFDGVKAHHMQAIQAYFREHMGLGDNHMPSKYDEALEKFGFRRK